MAREQQRSRDDNCDIGSHRDPMSHINKTLDDDYDATRREDDDDERRDGAERWCFHLSAQRYVVVGLAWPWLTSPFRV